uniref:Ricin B lectin domain-containing protein n=2 Tax=Rhizophagus irregularis TaxID=588596 RepID=U9UJQ4_RHIID
MKVRYTNKSLHYLGFLLFFIISTYCYLIPNDWVNTDDPDDFDLIEGITYNIVHSMSEKNLVNVGERVQVGAPNRSDPNQQWSLRRVEGLGRNLDNNGKGAYVSSPKHDSKKSKVVHITDNIANARMESLSLDSIDSNSELVYIKISNKNNRYQQWLFEPINYKLSTKVIDFDLNFKENKLERKLVNILSSNDTIENQTNATIKRWFKKEETKLNTYTLEIRKSESFKIGRYIDMSFEIGAIIFELPVKAGISGGIEGEFKKTTGDIYKETVTDEVHYLIQQKVSVPPFNSIQIIANTNRLSTSGKVIEMTNVGANAIRYYVQRENPGIKVMDENFFYIMTNGTLTINGYGYNSYTQLKTLESQGTLSPKKPESTPKKPESTPKAASESSPKNLVMFHQIILTLLQIIMLQFIYD